MSPRVYVKESFPSFLSVVIIGYIKLSVELAWLLALDVNHLLSLTAVGISIIQLQSLYLGCLMNLGQSCPTDQSLKLFQT